MWILNLASVEYVVQYWSQTAQLPESSRVEFHTAIFPNVSRSILVLSIIVPSMSSPHQAMVAPVRWQSVYKSQIAIDGQTNGRPQHSKETLRS